MPRNDPKIGFLGFSEYFMTSFYWEFSKLNEIFMSRKNVFDKSVGFRMDAVSAPKLWLPKK